MTATTLRPCPLEQCDGSGVLLLSVVSAVTRDGLLEREVVTRVKVLCACTLDRRAPAAPTPAPADERLAFENYHRSLGYSTSGLAQNVRGYVNSETRSLWLGFQAGAAWQAAAQTRAGGE